MALPGGGCLAGLLCKWGKERGEILVLGRNLVGTTCVAHDVLVLLLYAGMLAHQRWANLPGLKDWFQWMH